MAGIGGIVRNSSEDMAVASYAAVEAHNALEAEIKAIIRGVWICVDLNLSNILTERDSYIIRNTLHTGGTVSWNLMNGWRSLNINLERICLWKAILCRKTANSEADQLVKLAPPQEILFYNFLSIQIWESYLQRKFAHMNFADHN